MIKMVYIFLSCLLFLCLSEASLAGTAYLSWTASSDENVAGYKIYFDTQSHASGTCPNDYANFTSPIDAGNTTSYTATGLNNGQTYYFQITAYDALNNQSDCSYDPGEQSITIIAESANTSSNSGGGGGGGGGSATIPAQTNNTTSKDNNYGVSTSAISSPTELKSFSSLPQADNVEIITPTAIAELKMADEAKIIYDNSKFIDLSPSNLNLYSKTLSSVDKNVADQEKRSIAYFIQNGTLSTKILGAGERAGVIGSYISAFGHLPKTTTNWEDVIKISNGRWTNEHNLNTENSAITIFKKIYLRVPKRKTIKYDDNAIMIIAYGIRPVKRNIGSEAAAIKSFKYIFSHQPDQANDWDVVRAIAYSGAKR